MRLPFALCLVALSLPAAGLRAQSFTTGACPPEVERNSGHNWYNGHHTMACETRSTTLPAPAHLDVNGVNGAIEVTGEDRSDVALEAIVIAQADNMGDAEATLHQVALSTSPAIEAHGPQMNGNSNPQWHVDFHLHVPRAIAATLRTFNGPITLSALSGTVEARTNNGPLSLRDLAGDISATTTNGPVSVSLSGKQWEGKGLIAQTTNGGISFAAPSGYSAHLVAQTTNGAIAVNLPVSNRGDSRTHLDTNLGQGGATLQLTTTNGGISLSPR